MYDYNARFYSPLLGRFISADTVVPEPGNPQVWNRYSYTYNNSLKYVDPTGHITEKEARDYYGYSGNKDEIKKAMINDDWQENMVDWLLDDDTHFGDVFTYEDQSGNTSEAMLGLFETGEAGSGLYVGGFYGLNGEKMGQAVSRNDILSLNDHTQEAANLEKLYEGDYAFLPRKGGTDGRNYYDPVKYSDLATLGNFGAGTTIVGTFATTVVAVGCLGSGPGWAVCMGGTAGVISAGLTGAGFGVTISSPSGSIDYPLLRIPNIYDNAPNISGFGAPSGYHKYH